MISKRPREVERPGLVGQHHQGNDRDDGRLEEGSADRQEPDFTFCFFIHHSANALAPGSFRVHWQGGLALMSAGQAPRRAVQSEPRVSVYCLLVLGVGESRFEHFANRLPRAAVELN